MNILKNKPLFSLTVGEKATSWYSKGFLNIDEVAELTGYARQTLYGLVSAGRIPYIKRPGSKFLRFKRTEVEAWMTSNRIRKSSCNKLKTKAI